MTYLLVPILLFYNGLCFAATRFLEGNGTDDALLSFCNKIFKIMHFAVTGGAGFIGSHLTEQLLSEGHRVTIVNNLTPGRLHNIPKHPQLNLILKNIVACQPEDFTAPIDGMAHLAATPSVTESWLCPLETHHNNLSSMISVIQLCHHLKIPRLVFASSAAVYGQQKNLPISEEQPVVPISPYGVQKVASEQYGNLFAKQLDFSFIALRIFDVFGPRQPQYYSSDSGVISIFLNAMRKNLPIAIYGNGSETRDFIYVKDVAIAFTKALITPLEAGSSIACNVGTGRAISTLQLVDILKNCFPQWNSKIKFKNSRTGDILHSQADIAKTLSFLGFKSQWSVEDSIRFWVKSLEREG